MRKRGSMDNFFKNRNRIELEKAILLRKVAKIIKTPEGGIKRGELDLETSELLLVS